MHATLQALAGTLQNIRLETEGQTAVLTMNRPKALNALSSQTLDELNQIFEALAAAPEVLGVIITGEGKAFVAGADISQMQPYKCEEGRSYAAYAQSVFNRIEALEKPVIAAVNGFALGGGCELAMSCDLRIASEAAVFGQPEVKLGLIPCFGGTQRLPRLIGVGRAKELIYTGRQVKAPEALAIGLVNRVVPAQELLAAAKETMAQILTMSPVAVRYSKVAINRGLQADLFTGLELEKDIVAVVFGSQDKQEGVDAFLEKRSPVFPNK